MDTDGDAAPPGVIHQLATADVNRICSGQVITQLATAVKELLENAIDAGSTTVEIRLTEYGSEEINVSDNGSGIQPSDYASVALKSCTSKLTTFEDLTEVTSFGFRGEALAALCELSEAVTITTRTAAEAIGAELVLDRSGRVVGQRPVPRPVGTTVSVRGLFQPLPVRHREFLRGLKRHYARLLLTLQQYALVAGSLKLVVSHLATGSSDVALRNHSVWSTGGGSAGFTVKPQATSSWEHTPAATSRGSGLEASSNSCGVAASSIHALSATAGLLETCNPPATVAAALPLSHTLSVADSTGGIGWADGAASSADDSASGSGRGGSGRRSIAGGGARQVVLTTSGLHSRASGTPVAVAAARLPVTAASLHRGVVDVFGVRTAEGLQPLEVALDAHSHLNGGDCIQHPGRPKADPAVAGDEPGRDPCGGASAASPLPHLPEAAATASAGRIVGLVSRAGTGVGRSNNERQFTYLNGRPVDLPRLHKVVNEVWRTYELGHKPAFALDLQLPPGSFDVNVTPDKREALLVGEADLVSRLKAALHSAWEESRRTFPAAPLLTTATLDSFASTASLLPAASAASGATAAALSRKAGQGAPASDVGADPASAGMATPASAVSGRAAVLAALTGAAGSGAGAATASLKSKARGRSILEVAAAAAAGTATGARPNASTAGAPPVRALPPWSQPALGGQDAGAASASSSHGAHGRGEAEGAAEVACCPPSQLSTKRRRPTSIDPSAQPAPLETSSASCCSGLSHHSAAVCDHGYEGASGATAVSNAITDSVPRAKRPRAAEGVCECSPSKNVEAVSDSSEAAREVRVGIDDGEARRTSAGSGLQRLMSQAAQVSAPAEFDVDWQRVVAVSEAKESALRRGIATLRRTRERDCQALPPTADEGAADVAAAHARLTVDQQFRVLMEATELAATEVWHGQSGARRLLRQRSQLRRDGGTPAPPAVCRQEAAASQLPPLTHTSAEGLLGPDGVETADALEGATGAGSVTAAALGDAGTVGPAGAAPVCRMSSASAAEAALTRTLHQAQFRQMSGRVFGQFNLGFIIASVGGGDVYIVDQHASHEKARYEHLMASTVMHEQRLLLPRPIDLTAGEEGVVLDHMPTFNSNGFHFAVDMAQPPGRRLRLSAVPFSRGVTFGDEDVRELASVLAEGAGSGEQIVRIPKTAAVFASRACRSAVMIGDPLSLDRMRSIVAGLAQLHQPWNCPHGRPTLRHLVDLSRLPSALCPAGSDEALSIAPLDVEAADGDYGVAGSVTARQAEGQDDEANGDELRVI